MYSIRTTSDFDKQFRKLDRSVQLVVSKWINKHLLNCDNPRVSGKQLAANLSGYWRYRIGDYRITAEIKNTELVIIAISIVHRSEVYNK